MTPTSEIARRSKLGVDAALDKRLASYAVAAGAACVGILAGTAEAKIVYTPTNVSMLGNLLIDVNNDGTPDFELVEFVCGSHAACIFINPLVPGNGIKGSFFGAAAGVYGLPVGPQGQFLTKFYRITSTESAVGFMVEASAYGGQSFHSGGPWADTTNRYLGLKFLIDGKVHYGWARLSIKLFKSAPLLTGYAYETIPNHKILEGYTQGLNAETFSPLTLPPGHGDASLGALARGAGGLAIWRREDEVVAA